MKRAILAFGLAASASAQTIYVNGTTGNDSNSGLTSGTAVKTIATGITKLNAANGNILSVASGTYYETITMSNMGSSSKPIWIKSETPGGATITNNWKEAAQGTVTWTADSGGGGVYYASRSVRPYIGSHGNDFLMYYNSEADLRATTITAYSALAGANRTITKPDYGYAFSSTENRVYIKLRNGVNPNGQSIKLTGAWSQSIITMNNCDYVYWDGFKIEGAGATAAMTLDSACTNVIVRNCEITGSRFGVRTPSNTTLEWCTYRYIGMGQWARDVFALDGHADNGVFVLVKGYYNGDLFGAGGGSGNALLEGALDSGDQFSPAPTNVLIDNCLIGPCFDGSRIGTNNSSTVRNTVFFECRDDGLQNEGPTGHPATGNKVYNNKFLNCYRDISVQGDLNVGDFHVYRNLIVWNDFDLSTTDGYSLKMNKASTNSNTYVYQNTWFIDYGQSAGGAQRVWSDFGGISNANRILHFFNNVVVCPRDINDGPGTDPQLIEKNAVVGPSSTAVTKLLQGSGVFAGTATSTMALNSDYSLQSSSPARGIGRSLPGGFPDTGVGNTDAGAFPYGTSPGSNWPRPSTITYTATPPPGFSGGSPNTYQAEDATLAGGNVVETQHAGYNGTGYVNSSVTNGTTTFNNVDGLGGGTRTMEVRYALGNTSRTGELIVNGGTPSSITMNQTAGWTDYQTMNVNVSLNSGTGNTIQFKSTGADLGNVDQITISASGAPAAPSGLGATAASSSQINLSWTDNSSDETGFKIERKTGAGGSWSQITTTGANATSYNNTGLSASTTYYYRVRATNASGDSAFSNEANATTQAGGPSPVANYQFTSSGTATTDSSGNGNTLTFVNGAAYDSAGKTDGCVLLDGSNDRAEAANSSTLNITGNKITLAAWVRFDAIDGSHEQIICKPFSATSHTDPYFSYSLHRFNSGKMVFRLVIGGVVKKITGSTTVAANTWYHVAGVYNGVDLRLYLNGVSDGTPVTASGNITGYTTPMRIGIGGGDVEPLDGRADGVRIYNVALTASEVAALHSAGN